MAQGYFCEMRAFWRRLLKRDRPESGRVVLDRRRVYILPTRHGFFFALILLAMLLGSINYGISLGYILTFLLASLGVVSILHTFRNLNRLAFRAGQPQPVYCGEPALFPLQLQSDNALDRFAITINPEVGSPLHLDLAGGETHWVTLHRPTQLRGYLPLGRLTVETTFPLGMFRAWGYLNLDSQLLVYPRPAEKRGLPPEVSEEGSGGGDLGRGQDDFANLRPYHPGDSLRHIHWKVVARGQELVTKQFGGGVEQELWLRWEDLGQLDVESRLSRLTRWIIEADAGGYAYGLALPHRSIKPSRGDLHRHHCLEALALFGQPAEGK